MPSPLPYHDRLSLTHELLPIYNRIDISSRIRLQTPTARHAPYLCKTKRVPDPARRDVVLIHEIEDGIPVALQTVRTAKPTQRRETYQLWRPRQIRLSHAFACAPAARRTRHEKPAVADVTGAPWIIRLDVEAAEA